MRIALIANPAAGQGRGQALLNAGVERLRASGAEVTLLLTTARGDAERLAAEANSETCDLVGVAGGDGTVNEVVNGLTGAVPLGLLPSGTANVLARELSIPLNDAAGACELMLSGRQQPMDLGECNGRKFALMAGIGFDADAVKDVPPNVKDLVGAPAYVLSGLKTLATLPGAIRYRLLLPQREVHARGMMLVVANAASYAGPLKVASLASLDDGQFDLCLFRERSRLAFVGQLVNVLMRRQLQDPNLVYLRSPELTVDCRPRASVQLDGDYFGRTPGRLRTLPRAIRVVRP